MKGIDKMKELELDFNVNQWLEENKEKIKERAYELEREGFSFRIPDPDWEDIKDFLYPW